MTRSLFNLGSIVERIVDLLLPGRCAFCALPSASRCCDNCAALLPKNEICCHRCANPLALKFEGVCADCQQQTPYYSATIAPLIYEFPVDTALKAMKDRRQLFYVPLFSDILLRALRDRSLPIDVIVPVPLHRIRHATRGFNQAEELAGNVARRCGLPIFTGVKRKRSTRSQRGLSAVERRQNLRGAFAVTKRLRFRRPLIIDDVMTTGQTCNELAGSLLASGAVEVYVLVVARARVG